MRLGGPKQRATLAILLLNANRVVPVDRLAEDLYRGAAPVTAVTQVQRQVSDLRRLLDDASAIETRSPGYVMRVAPEQLDLHRFERRAEQAAEASARGNPQRAADLLREALGLWRGEALADLADEPFARAAIERLEEIRLAALERRIDAELALGRHAELVGELQELSAAHPLGERFHGQLMLALYRSGRQTEALDVYRATREALVAEFGIEPTPALRSLERAILTQDPSLELAAPAARAAGTEAPRPLLVLPSDERAAAALLSIAAPLARPVRELVVARLLADDRGLGREAAALNAIRASVELDVRTAAFTTEAWADDAARLASTSDAALVLLDTPAGIDGAELPGDLAALLERSPADVGILVGKEIEWGRGAGVFVPFGGGVHDWAALELAAWLAQPADRAAPARRHQGRSGSGPARCQPAPRRRGARRAAARRRLVGAAPGRADRRGARGRGRAGDGRRAGRLAALAARRHRRVEARGSCAVAARRCSCTAARVPAASRPRESRTRFTWSIQPLSS